MRRSGFCTPGMLMTSNSCCDNYADARDVRDALGNTCRCTGYQAIVDAAMAAEPGRRTP